MPEPRIATDYNSAITEASKSVLIELMTILKGYREALVLIGGWVPYFLLARHKPQDIEFSHVGSIDIDLVINPEVIDERKYKSIARMLLDRGYAPSKEILYQFERKVSSPVDGKEYTVGIDFLTPEPLKGKGRRHRHRQIQPDLKARNLTGAEVVLKQYLYFPLAGTLPGNGKAEVEFKMADVASFSALKGVAFGDRYKEKDAYDIYSLYKYYEKGPKSIIPAVKPFIANPVVKRGLTAVRSRFRDIKAEGPFWVANFLALSTKEEIRRVQLDAFMIVDEVLKNLGF